MWPSETTRHVKTIKWKWLLVLEQNMAPSSVYEVRGKLSVSDSSDVSHKLAFDGQVIRKSLLPLQLGMRIITA